MDMPQLTDRAALMRNRARAEPSALFLHEHTADELHERLIEVNKTFTSVAIVTACMYFPDILWFSHLLSYVGALEIAWWCRDWIGITRSWLM